MRRAEGAGLAGLAPMRAVALSLLGHGSHVAMISNPKITAKLIEQAAEATD